ncbi:MAG: hypothetical protein HQK91_08060 [Nitrospirae bacterium]|nr:hypothetical protein [Nitrospirota bacterium]MBF0541389.1 hypothetical protein [Nitrospirota bacterium]
MNITIDETQLKEIIREVFKEEFIKLSINLTPYVSQNEMEEINNTYSDEDFTDNQTDFIDMTSWLGR